VILGLAISVRTSDGSDADAILTGLELSTGAE
jgi:hypothetical protein